MESNKYKANCAFLVQLEPNGVSSRGVRGFLNFPFYSLFRQNGSRIEPRKLVY
jgi:hypothetical protein